MTGQRSASRSTKAQRRRSDNTLKQEKKNGRQTQKRSLYVRYTRSCRPQYFASWAKPKASELNILRHRHLGGNQEVIWDIAKDSGKAADHIEMAGFYASAIISYGKNKDGELKLMNHLTVPTLRFKPDLTESSFSHNFNGCALR